MVSINLCGKRKSEIDGLDRFNHLDLAGDAVKQEEHWCNICLCIFQSLKSAEYGFEQVDSFYEGFCAWITNRVVLTISKFDKQNTGAFEYINAIYLLVEKTKSKCISYVAFPVKIQGCH